MVEDVLDEARLEELYTRLERGVYNVVYRWLWDPQESQDVVQETFMKLWRKRERVGADIHLPVAITDGERRAAPGGDNQVVLAFEKEAKREGAVEPRERRGDGVHGGICELVHVDEDVVDIDDREPRHDSSPATCSKPRRAYTAGGARSGSCSASTTNHPS